jgi:predicted metalloprotease with PDZ domain
MKGALSEDINIGFGILGRLRQGGTFDVERRQLAPGLWQITQTHVHIEGRALFFKTIGQQEDEVKMDFTEVRPGTTLEQAVTMLNQPAK